MNRCGVGAFEARRLVRTETTCVANMAELYGYKELDIDEYEFSACLDSRTSDLCRELDGKVFKRNSAQAGVNLPPMHPFCCSTTLPVLPSEEDLDKELAGFYDSKTKQIYTPNTDSRAKIDDAGLQNGGEGDIIAEKRYNDKHDEKGRFARKDGGSATGTGSLKMSRAEIKKVSSEISTNYSRYAGKKNCVHYSLWRNEYYQYRFINNGFADYDFIKKVKS